MRRRAALINLGFHWVGTGLLVLQGLLLTPVYARLIPLDLLGAWMATGNVVAWLTLIDPNISRVLQQRIARAAGAGNEQEIASLVAAGHVLGFGVGLAMAAFIPAVPVLLRYVPGAGSAPAELEASLVVSLAATGTLIASFAPGMVNVGLQRTFLAGIITAGATVVGVVFTFYALLAGWGLVSLPGGLLVRSSILFVLNAASVYVSRWRVTRWRIAPTWLEIRALLGPSGYTFLGRFGQAMTGQVEPMAIAFAAGASTTAQYSITSRPLEPIRMTVDRVLPALAPGLSHLAGERGNEAVAGVIGKVYGPLGGLASIGVAAVTLASGPLVTLWAGPGTFAGYAVAAAVGVAAVGSSLASPAGEILYALGDVRSVALGRILEGALRIVAQVVGALVFGSIGIILGGVLATSGVALAWMNPRAERAMKISAGGINRRYLQSLLLGAAAVVTASLGGGAAFRGTSTTANWSILAVAMAGAVGVSLLGLFLWPGLRRESIALAGSFRRGRSE